MARRREPLLGKMVTRQPLELEHAKILANRFLKSHNVNLFLAQIIDELLPPASEAEAPNVPT